MPSNRLRRPIAIASHILTSVPRVLFAKQPRGSACLAPPLSSVECVASRRRERDQRARWRTRMVLVAFVANDAFAQTPIPRVEDIPALIVRDVNGFLFRPFASSRAANPYPVDAGSFVTPPAGETAYNVGLRRIRTSVTSEAAEEYKMNCGPAALSMREVLDGSAPQDETNSRTAQFDSKCLASFSKLPDSIRLLIGAVVGVLYDLSSKRYFCSATLIDATTLITARHCLYTDGSLRDLRDIDRMAFFRVANPGDALSVVRYEPPFADWVHKERTIAHQTDDFVFLRLKQAVVTPTIPLGPPAELGEKLWIPSVNLFAMAQAEGTAARDSKGPGSGWIEYMRIDDSPYCLVTGVGSDVCIFHACQSLYGMSGSAMIVGDAAKLRIVGVHIGTPITSTTNKDACFTSRPLFEVNVGVFPSVSRNRN